MEPISVALSSIRATILTGLPLAEAVREAWPMVSGASVAEKTSVESFAAGELRVRVPSRQWQVELAAWQGEYLRRLEALLPDGVSKITFILE